MPDEAVCFAVRTIGSAPADWPRWHLDHPVNDRPAPRRANGRFELRAWVLPVQGAPVRLATCVAGITRVHDPDMERRDVIAKMLPDAPGADPCCGYAVALPIAGHVRVGLARRGELHWLVEFQLAEP
jgi:hypothetical protein